MNNAKEKAEQLWSKFSNTCGSWIEGRRCAIIAVDEILTYIDSKGNGYYTLPDDLKNEFDYYEEVKQHLK